MGRHSRELPRRRHQSLRLCTMPPCKPYGELRTSVKLGPIGEETENMDDVTRQLLVIVAALLLGYLVVAYLIMPAHWRRYATRHPSLEDVPGVTHTASGIPGDPLNVALVGTEAEIRTLMASAKWYPADPLSLRSDLRIAADTVLDRPYDDAPVSSLYLWGHKEDLAFEQPVGNDPRQRHHVRFWQSDLTEPDGRRVWVGSVTYDTKVGISRTTGQITHHIAPDVDAERDHLFHGLEQTGRLSQVYPVKGFHKILEGTNGGGDPWRTNGTLIMGVIAAGGMR